MNFFKEQAYSNALDELTSKASYIAGLRKVASIYNEHYPQLSLFSFIESAYLLANGDAAQLDSALRLIEGWLEALRDKQSDYATKRGYNNYLSYFRKYRKFLTEACQEETFELEAPQTKTRRKFFYLSEEYREWLETESNLSSDNSINSYLSTLRSPKTEQWLGKEGVSLLYFKNEDYSPLYTLHTIDELTTLIGRITAQIEQRGIVECKTLSDHRSHIRKYIAFLESYRAYIPDEEGEELLLDEEETYVPQSSIISDFATQIFEQEDLQRKFSFRLNTQDRFNQKDNALYYPISLVVKLAKQIEGGAEQNNQFITEQIKSIKFVVDDKGNSITIDAIDKLEITPEREVYVYSQGQKMRLYTELAHSGTYSPMFASDISEVVIDHKRLISSILTQGDAHEKYPCISKLTSELKALEQATFGSSTIAPRDRKYLFANEYQASGEVLNSYGQILREMLAITQECGLQMMSAEENRRKKR